MKTVIFLPLDEIIRQGDKGSKIYFISRGKVDVYIGPDELQDRNEKQPTEIAKLVTEKALRIDTGNSSPRSLRSGMVRVQDAAPIGVA